VRRSWRILLVAAKLMLVCSIVGFAFNFFVSQEDWATLMEIAWSDLLKILLAAQLVYAISGVEFAVIVYFSSRVRLSVTDILVLPITMNFWSFLIPFQGALVYSSLILKCKYKARVSEAIASSVFSYLLSMSITGMFGVTMSFLAGRLLSPWMAASVILMLCPLILFVVDKVMSWLPGVRIQLVNYASDFVHKIVAQMWDLFRVRRLLCLLFVTNVLHITTSFVMNFYAADALNVVISWPSLLIFTLLIRLSVILKVTPGNIGIQEVLSGGIFSLMTLDPGSGILITLLTRLITAAQMCTFGVVDTMVKTKYFPIKSIFSGGRALIRRGE
jgi:hypothetical protein